MNNKSILITVGAAATSIILSYLGFTYFANRRAEQRAQELKQRKKKEHQLEEEIKVLEMRHANEEAFQKLDELQKLNPNSMFALYRKLFANIEESDVKERLKLISEMKKIAKTDRDKNFAKFCELNMEVISGNFRSVEKLQTVLLEILVKYPSDVYILYEAALFYAMTQQLPEVRKKCDQIMALPGASENDTARAQFLRAATLSRPEERDERFAQVKQILSSRPFFIDALLERATLFLESGKIPEAMQDIKKALEVNPKVVGAHILKAQILLEQQSFDDVIKECNEIIKLKKSLAESYQMLISVYCSSAKRSYEEASRVAKQMVENCDQNDVMTHIGKITVALAFNKFDECAMHATEMAQVAQTPQHQQLAGGLLAFVNDLKAGLETYPEMKEIVEKQEPPYAQVLNKEFLRKIQIKQSNPAKKTKAEEQSWYELATVIAFLSLAGQPNLSMAFQIVEQFATIVNEVARTNPAFGFLPLLINNAYILHSWFIECIRVPDVGACYWLSEQYLQQVAAVIRKAQEQGKDVHQAVIDETDVEVEGDPLME